MSNESPVANPSAGSVQAGQVPGYVSEDPAAHGIIKRRDGVYVDPALLGPTLQTAVNNIFFAKTFFIGLDYPVLIKALYNCGPDLPRSKTGEVLIRVAADIVPFVPERLSLYKAVKINGGRAEYYFEPVYLHDPADPEGSGVPAKLDFDEFVADMWMKGIRFGIDVTAVRAAIESGKAERVVVAQRLEPVPGVDATIIEVSQDLHRSNAPRQLANGRLDLMAFQNRFPQIQKGIRLLKKEPRRAGVLGYELSGIPLEPPIPKDVELGSMAGAGTVIDITAEGEFLVAMQTGYLNIEAATNKLSIGDKIVSREGVSSRTTGNLVLTGDYEEFGEVQEKRVLEGDSITIHADVFGNIVSRGGTIQLNHNLVGGSAHNAKGDIHVKGVTSGAVVQTREGEVVMNKADGCIVSGTRVIIDHAINCEIIADEVSIKLAEGCAVAGRKVMLESAGPRKQSEMLVFALVPDNARLDEQIAEFNAKAEEFGQVMAKRRADMETLTNLPDVRKYLMLATRIRKKELSLTPEQEVQFQKMALAVGPALKAISQFSLNLKQMEAARDSALALVAEVAQQKAVATGEARVQIGLVEGDVLVRTMKFTPDGTQVFDLAAKDIKPRLRNAPAGGDVVYAGSNGTLDWSFDAG